MAAGPTDCPSPSMGEGWGGGDETRRDDRKIVRLVEGPPRSAVADRDGLEGGEAVSASKPFSRP